MMPNITNTKGYNEKNVMLGNVKEIPKVINKYLNNNAINTKGKI